MLKEATGLIMGLTKPLVLIMGLTNRRFISPKEARADISYRDVKRSNRFDYGANWSFAPVWAPKEQQICYRFVIVLNLLSELI